MRTFEEWMRKELEIPWIASSPKAFLQRHGLEHLAEDDQELIDFTAEHQHEIPEEW